MTSIRRLALTHTLGYVVILSIMTIVTRWFWSYPQELQLAQENQHKDLVSIQNAIQSFHENLTFLAHDYANYPEVRRFTKRTLTFPIEMAKQEFNFMRYELDYFVIANTENEILLALYRTDDNIPLEFSEDLKKGIQEKYLSMPAGDVLETFELFRNNPVMTSSVPIYDSNNRQKVIGRLITAWKLHGKSLQELSEILQISLNSSSQQEIAQSEKIPLYSPIHEEVERDHIRCLFDHSQTLVSCLTITHDQQLIPDFLTFRTLASTIAFGMVPLIFFMIMLNYLVRPMETSTQFLKSISGKRDLKPLDKEAPIAELDDMRLAFNDLVDVIKEQQQELQAQSMTDPLTGIANRRAFDQEIENTWSRLKRHSGSAALILCDIDFFKLYNDNYGHPQGDQVLKKVADNLKHFGRRTDEICARYGGEEFAILLSAINKGELVQDLDNILASIEALQQIHEYSPFSWLTLSCGAVLLDNSDIENSILSSHDDWVELTDQALYEAKKRGRNQYVIFPSHQAIDSKEQ